MYIVNSHAWCGCESGILGFVYRMDGTTELMDFPGRAIYQTLRRDRKLVT